MVPDCPPDVLQAKKAAVFTTRALVNLEENKLLYGLDNREQKIIYLFLNYSIRNYNIFWLIVNLCKSVKSYSIPDFSRKPGFDLGAGRI